jgi:hypothetical protein
MWWRSEPKTDAERQREIARLEGVRDRLLADAPRQFVMQKAIFLIMFAGYLAMVANTLLFHREGVTLGFFVFAILFGLICGTMLFKSFMHPPAKADRWGMADRLGYEGDSPRDIQAKIDRLRAQNQSGA